MIVATGGYANNKSMLQALQPETALMAGFTISEGATKGDGIRACLWAGAKMDDHHTSILFDRCAIMPDETPATLRKAGHPTEFIGQPFLKVDLKGRRFMNESVPYDFIIHRSLTLPGQCYCVIFRFGLPGGHEAFRAGRLLQNASLQQRGTLQNVALPDNVALMESMIREGRFVRSETIEGLAEGLGLPPAALAATVARLYELWDKQVDEDFGKEPYRLSAVRKPPYYGVRACAFLLGTLDGILIDENMNALDDSGDAIPGLYVAGNDSGGFYANTYVNLVTGGCARPQHDLRPPGGKGDCGTLLIRQVFGPRFRLDR